MTTPALPFYMPYPRNLLFIGRKTELVQLEAILATPTIISPVPAIAGPGGVGKSQLAVELAYRALQEERFPGGIFWISMADPEGVSTQVAQLGGPDGLNLPGWASLSFDDQIAATMRAWREPIARLLIFDNLGDLVLFQRWRPANGGSQILITTRNTQWPIYSGVGVVALEGLDRTQSVRLLLTSRARTEGALRNLLSDATIAQAADAVCELFGDLPLALTVAGAYLERFRSLSVPDYHQRLLTEVRLHPSLDQDLATQLPTGHESSIVATFRTSYDQLRLEEELDAQGLRLLHRAAYCAPDPLPPILIERLAAMNTNHRVESSQVDIVLERLASLGLLRLLEGNAAQLHPLLAAFARHVAPNPEEIEPTGQALYDIIYDNLRAITFKDASLLLSHANAVIRSVDRYLAVSRAGYLLPTLLDASAQMLEILGAYSEARTRYERALAIIDAAIGGDTLSKANLLNNLAALLNDQGAHDEARPLYEQALKIFRGILGPDHPTTAQCLNSFANLLRDQGAYDQARPLFEDALQITERFLGPHHPFVATSLNSLADLLRDQGVYDQARLLYERANQIWERSLGPNHPSTAISLNSLANLLRDQGAYDQARPLYERALNIRERVLGREHPHIADSLINIADLYRFQDAHDQARPLYERALNIRERVLGLDHPRTKAVRDKLADLQRADNPT